MKNISYCLAISRNTWFHERPTWGTQAVQWKCCFIRYCDERHSAELFLAAYHIHINSSAFANNLRAIISCHSTEIMRSYRHKNAQSGSSKLHILPRVTFICPIKQERKGRETHWLGKDLGHKHRVGEGWTGAEGAPDTPSRNHNLMKSAAIGQVLEREKLRAQQEPKSLLSDAFLRLQICQNALVAGTPPRDMLESLQPSQNSSWILKRPLCSGEGRVKGHK